MLISFNIDVCPSIWCKQSHENIGREEQQTRWYNESYFQCSPVIWKHASFLITAPSMVQDNNWYRTVTKTTLCVLIHWISLLIFVGIISRVMIILYVSDKLLKLNAITICCKYEMGLLHFSPIRFFTRITSSSNECTDHISLWTKYIINSTAIRSLY